MTGGANRPHEQKEDAPPSYSEAIKSQVESHANYTAITPSAPALELAFSENRYTPNAPAYFPEADTSHSLAQSYPDADKWDNRATRMLVINRLQMQNRLNNTTMNKVESEVVWNTLLNQLLGYGYNFSTIDLINYWQFQFEIYESIVKRLQSGALPATDWEFFEPMNRVFQHYVVAADLSDAVPSSTPPIFLDTPVPLPVLGSDHPILESVKAPSTTSPALLPTDTFAQHDSTALQEQSPLLMNSSIPATSLPSTNVNNTSNDAEKQLQEPITTQPESSAMTTQVHTSADPAQQQTTESPGSCNEVCECIDDGCFYAICCLECHQNHSHNDCDDCGDCDGCDLCDGCDGC